MLRFRTIDPKWRCAIFVSATLSVLLFVAACGRGEHPTQSLGTPPSALSAHAASSTQRTRIARASDAPMKTRTPQRRVIKPSDLPPPYATRSANNPPHIVPRPKNAALIAPPGFHVSEWATGFNVPRVLTVAPNGDVFVAESRANRITALRDADGDGKPEVRSVFASNLRQPFGIAFYPPGGHPHYVYVANTDSVVRFPYKGGDLKATARPQTVVNDLPGGGYNQHWTRNIVFSPSGKKMYVSVGSQSNVGVEGEKRAAVLEYNPDGSGYRVYASGLRNPVGLAFNPVDGMLWTAVNERDGLGDDLVPDFVTSVKEGGFYGWPFYYIGQNKDPRMAERPALKSKVIVPDVLLPSHSAALSIEFYTGSQFPAEYRNDAFVGLHGSWNRSVRLGYEVVRIPFRSDGKPEGGFESFVSGWKTSDSQVWGRPVDVAVARDGSFLISDDGAGKIWRVTYGKGQ